jgi:GntR family transcriptional regulator / MocR family aminotransferase
MILRQAPVTLDPATALPAYRQIADRLRAAIGEGALSPGDRLPSARSLAGQLGLARGTVDAAYAILAGEGYIQTRGPAGTIVSPAISVSPAPEMGGGLAERPTPAWPPKPVEPASWPDRRPAVADAADLPIDAPIPAPGPQPGLLPFRLGLPALDLFPRTLWARLVARAARQAQGGDLGYPDPAGLPALREAIAAYLRVARGIVCTPDDVLITSGYQGALALAAGLLVQPGDPVWIEDPAYFLAREVLDQRKAALVPVPVDQEGARIVDGVAAAPHARLAVFTPTHQSPFGVALSLPRRLAVLGWAAEAGAWLIEDDYDSEFRYTGRPLPALKSLDRQDRVLYAGSFSKVLFPGLRLGYLVPPRALCRDLLAASRAMHAGLPGLEQRVVAAFMAEGHFARHLRRMRLRYAARRQALADALRVAFGDRIRLELQAGGMHLLARFPDWADDQALVRRATAAGLAPSGVSTLSLTGHAGNGLLLGFTNVPESRAAHEAARLAAAFGMASPAADTDI